MNAVIYLIISVLSVLVIPLIILLWKIAVGITTSRDKIDNIEADLKALVNDKDRAHKEITDQMREDRLAANQRLRWLEEHLWKQIGGRP